MNAGGANGPTLFLSHSSADKIFARQLHASLSAVRLPCFLYEFDIMVGESIPERVFSSIESSTHLLFAISKSSVASAWTREELSAAQMRQLGQRGIHILPLLVEDSDLPTQLRHIRYADFRDWQDPTRYRAAIQDLLRALQVEGLPGGSDVTQWFIENHATLRRVEQRLSYVSGILEAPGTHAGSERVYYSFHSVAKHIFYDTDFKDVLHLLAGALVDGPPRASEVLAHSLAKTMDAVDGWGRSGVQEFVREFGQELWMNSAALPLEGLREIRYGVEDAIYGLVERRAAER